MCLCVSCRPMCGEMQFVRFHSAVIGNCAIIRLLFAPTVLTCTELHTSCKAACIVTARTLVATVKPH